MGTSTSEKKIALYAGTFDPFTNGHKDIVSRARQIFDEVVIVIAVPPKKKPFLDKDIRLEMINEIFKSDTHVKVDFWDGLIVDYAKKHGISNIVRGLRPTGDFEIEFQMAAMNHKLFPEIETVFLMTGGKHYFVSSTLVKEVFTHGGDISAFVPEEVLKRLKNHSSKK